jgi:hypothetical protein
VVTVHSIVDDCRPAIGGADVPVGAPLAGTAYGFSTLRYFTTDAQSEAVMMLK